MSSASFAKRRRFIAWARAVDAKQEATRGDSSPSLLSVGSHSLLGGGSPPASAEPSREDLARQALTERLDKYLSEYLAGENNTTRLGELVMILSGEIGKSAAIQTVVGKKNWLGHYVQAACGRRRRPGRQKDHRLAQLFLYAWSQVNIERVGRGERVASVYPPAKEILEWTHSQRDDDGSKLWQIPDGISEKDVRAELKKIGASDRMKRWAAEGRFDKPPANLEEK